ncbi:unnamed protein product [Candidula unifasciata]|uniref:Uncharacterized protein n=1 Tax=Candidula unifasciata TaxID=100452 RepID=A0A8S3YXS5_9EUPU|nr:unnamed protein product [Candidula unifasciata]
MICQKTPHQLLGHSKIGCSASNGAPTTGSRLDLYSNGRRESLTVLPQVTSSQVNAGLLKPLLQLISENSQGVPKERLQELISHTVDKMFPEADISTKLGLKEFLAEELSHLNSQPGKSVPFWRQGSSVSRCVGNQTETMSSDNCWVSLLISLLPDLDTVEVCINGILGQLTEALVAELHGLTFVGISSSPEMDDVQPADKCVPGQCDTLAGQDLACTYIIEQQALTAKRPLSTASKESVSETQPLFEVIEHVNTSPVISDISEFSSLQDSHRNLCRVCSHPDLYRSAHEASSTSYSSVLCDRQYERPSQCMLGNATHINSRAMDTVIDNTHSPLPSGRRRVNMVDDRSKTGTFYDYQHLLKAKHANNQEDDVFFSTEIHQECNKNTRSTKGVHKSNSASSLPSTTSTCLSSPNKPVLKSATRNTCGSSHPDLVSSPVTDPWTRSHSDHCQNAYLACRRLSTCETSQAPRKLLYNSEEDCTSIEECFSEMENSLVAQDDAGNDNNLSQESVKCHRRQPLRERLWKNERTSTACSLGSGLAGVDTVPEESQSATSLLSSKVFVWGH